MKYQLGIVGHVPRALWRERLLACAPQLSNETWIEVVVTDDLLCWRTPGDKDFRTIPLASIHRVEFFSRCAGFYKEVRFYADFGEHFQCGITLAHLLTYAPLRLNYSLFPPFITPLIKRFRRAGIQIEGAQKFSLRTVQGCVNEFFPTLLFPPLFFASGCGLFWLAITSWSFGPAVFALCIAAILASLTGLTVLFAAKYPW